MKFIDPLTSGTIIRRYKRFLADIELPSGEILTVHTPNTGPMTTCWQPGWQVLLSHSLNSQRKYPYTLEMIHNGDSWIGVNTMLPNRLVPEAIAQGMIPELLGYENMQREVKTGSSKIDLLLNFPNKEKCYVEIKNVTMLGKTGGCLFPDAVTERGSKHLRELITLKDQGHRAAIFFLVQREDVHHFSPARSIDPIYTQNLLRCQEVGVEILIYQCALSPLEINIRRPLPLQWNEG